MFNSDVPGNPFPFYVDGVVYPIWSERSLPKAWHPTEPFYGIVIDAEGPTHLDTVHFSNPM